MRISDWSSDVCSSDLAFRSFKLRGLCRWAERLDPRLRQSIGQAFDQRLLRADHHQVDLVFPAKCDDRAVIGHIEGDTFALVCDTGVAGRGDRMSVESGKRGYVRVDTECRRILKKITATPP